MLFALALAMTEPPLLDCLYNDPEDITEHVGENWDVYFSPDQFACEGDHREWGEHWGAALAAMEEPSFSASNAIDGYKARYRLLVLPSFDPPYVVRIDERHDGQGHVTTVMADGAGGYEPGNKVPLWNHVAADWVIPETKNELTSGAILEQPSFLEFGVPDENGAIMICSDGTSYLFEALSSEGRHQIIDRHSCDIDRSDQKAFADLIAHMLNVGRLTIPYEVAQIVWRR